MATTNKSKADLEAENEDLREELDAAYSKLDEIVGIAGDDEVEDEAEDDEDEEVYEDD